LSGIITGATLRLSLRPREVEMPFLDLGHVEHAMRLSADQLTAFEPIPRCPSRVTF
jgi:hypothetical protein